MIATVIFLKESVASSALSLEVMSDPRFLNIHTPLGEFSVDKNRWDDSHACLDGKCLVKTSGTTPIKLSIAAVSVFPSIGIASPELTLRHMVPHTNRRNRMSIFHLPCMFVADLSRQ